MEAYNERLVEREEDNQLDSQELGQRFPPLEFLPRQSVEDDETVKCNPARGVSHGSHEAATLEEERILTRY